MVFVDGELRYMDVFCLTSGSGYTYTLGRQKGCRKAYVREVWRKGSECRKGSDIAIDNINGHNLQRGLNQLELKLSKHHIPLCEHVRNTTHNI